MLRPEQAEIRINATAWYRDVSANIRVLERVCKHQATFSISVVPATR